MRKLQTKDLFKFTRMIKKIGLKEEIKKIGLEAEKATNVSEYGFEMLYSIMEAASNKNAEKEIYIFLSDIFGTDVKGMEEMELTVLFEGLMEAADVNTWKRFFKQAATLTK